MRCQRRDGRKRIVGPDEFAIVPRRKPQPDGTLIKALARAWRWQRLLEGGEYGRSPGSPTPSVSAGATCRVLRLMLSRSRYRGEYS